MISYLGISIDDLLQAFEDSFVFSDDRGTRSLEEPIEVTEELVASEEEAESLDAEESEADEEEFEDDGMEEVFVDEEGRLHAIAPSVPAAAEAALDLLTDYIVADDIDPEWLTLDQARGALLALRVLFPSLEEIPEIDASYSFKIDRDPETGYPSFLSMQALPADSEVEETLSFDQESFQGKIGPRTSLLSLIEAAGVPENERELLFEVISEGVYTLDEQQCGIIFDARSFCQKIAELAAAPESASSQIETQH